MSTSIEALATPSVLRWAREACGYSIEDAAAKVPVKAERLMTWEIGDAHPTFNQLRELANVYKRPLPIFYLQAPPVEVTLKKDFRHQAGTAPTVTDSPELRLEIRKALLRRESALEVYALIQQTPRKVDFPLSESDDPEEIGSTVREWLGISLAQQFEWKDAYEALRGWRIAIESKGILVFQARGIEVSEMRGFSITRRPLPVASMNSKDDPKARVFSLLHELAHILLNSERQGEDEDVDLCDFGGNIGETPDGGTIEVYCNAFAGAVMVPKSSFLVQPGVRELDGTTAEDDLIAHLARQFTVSREVILRRLLALGCISRSFYQSKRAELVAQQSKIKTHKTGAPPPAQVALSTLGEHYTHLVLDGYHQEKVSSRDLADLLELRLPQVPKLETLLFTRGQGQVDA